MKSNTKQSIVTAILLSLLLVHLPLLVLLWKMDLGRSDVSPSELRKAVVVDLKSMQELPLVDIAKPEHEEVPDQASAQALYNSKVKEETTVAVTAKNDAPRGVPVKPAPAVKIPSPQPLPSSGTSLPPKGARGQESPTAMPAPNSKNTSNSMQDQLAMLESEQKQKEQKSFERFKSNAVMPDLRTNFGDESGGSREDFIPSYKVGGHTYVNAMANPQIGYYVELKRKFKMAWNPIPALRTQMQQISQGVIPVVWGLTIDQNGQIADLTLIKGSGLSNYDAEAKRTIIASGPFTHPPAALLDADGKIYMAWTFVVYM